MKILRFSVEIVTPLFICGVVQRERDYSRQEGLLWERILRPSSVRGMLRYWFRALAGPVLKYDYNAVKEFESLVFGSTSQGSQWLLRIRPFTEEPKVGNGEIFSSGISYLGYGPIVAPKVNRRSYPLGAIVAPKVTRGFYLPGKSTEIEVRWLTENEGLAKLLEATFWAWGWLGGAGARVRRGFGAIKLKPLEGSLLPLWDGDPQTPDELAEYLRKGLETCAEIFERGVEAWSIKAQERRRPSFFVLDSAFCELHVGSKVFRPGVREDGLWPAWKVAMDEVGNALKEFRRRKGWEKAALGLPLRIGEDMVTAILEEKGKVRETYSRRASPLRIRIFPLRDGVCVGLLWSKEEFLPAGAKLVSKTVKRDLPSTDLVGDFLKALFEKKDSGVYGKIGLEINVSLPRGWDGGWGKEGG